MWEVVFALDETGKPLGKSRFEYCRKNHPQAFAKLKYRVNVIVERLGSGLPPSDALRAGWIHPEKGNVFAIDSLPSTSPFRMYCAIRSHENRIVIFTVGDKKQQQKDLQAVFEWNSQL